MSYLWFQITMCYIIVVQHFNPIDYLMKKLACLHFRNIPMCYDVIKHFTSFCILHHQVNSIGCIQYFIELYNISMSGLFKNFNLTINAPYIGLLFNTIFLENLDSNLRKQKDDCLDLVLSYQQERKAHPMTDTLYSAYIPFLQ